MFKNDLKDNKHGRIFCFMTGYFPSFSKLNDSPTARANFACRGSKQCKFPSFWNKTLFMYLTISTVSDHQHQAAVKTTHLQFQ